MLEKYFLWLLAGIFNFWAAGFFYFPFQEMTTTERGLVLTFSAWLKLAFTLIGFELLRQLWKWVREYLTPKILSYLQTSIKKIESHPTGYRILTHLRWISRFMRPIVNGIIFLVTLPFWVARHIARAISIAGKALSRLIARGVAWIRNRFFSSTQRHPLLIQLMEWLRIIIKSPWVQAGFFALIAPWLPGGLSSAVVIAQSRYGRFITIWTFVISGIIWSIGFIWWAKILNGLGLDQEEVKKMVASFVPWLMT